MSELIERFQYRFQLWWRERYDDYIGSLGTRLSELREYWRESPVYDNPKYEVLLSESTPRFIIREVSLWVVVALILSTLGFWIDRFVPSARFAVGVTFIVLIGLSTVLSLLMAMDLAKRRKRYRTKPPKSSNRSMELTPGRRTTQLSHD